VRTLPSSFSRFVSEEDLNRVRDEFLSALAELEAEENASPTEGAGPDQSPGACAPAADIGQR
jgi:hypothetical protein